VAAVSVKDSAAAGVFPRAVALFAPLSVPLKWVPTSANLAAQCHYEPTLHALFFQTAQAL